MDSFEDDRIVRSAALWGAILNIGGILLVTGSLGYAALTLQAYENQCGSVLDCARPQSTEAVGSPEEAAQDVNMVGTVSENPARGTAPTETSPNGPDPSTTGQFQQVVQDLEAARGRLAEADATNAALQKRLAELEQQATATGETATNASGQVAQCRSELAGIHERYTQVIDRIRSRAERTEQALNSCRQQLGQPITG